MEKQSIKSIKNYISTVLILEKEKYELEKAIEKSRNSIIVPYIEQTLEVGKEEKVTIGDFIMLIIGVGAIPIGKALYDACYDGFGILLFFGGAIFAFNGFFGLLDRISLVKEDRKKREKIIAENEKIKYKNAITKLNIQKSNQLINNSISQYSKALTSVTKTLNTYYSQNLIHPKYRNLTALMYIFEYFDTGRATTLVEAYNFYEEEWRLDKIISEVNVILSKIDTIIYNQFDIMQSVKDSTKMIQETSDRLIAKANEISKNQKEIKANVNTINENVEIMKKAALIIEANQYYERNWENMRGEYDRIADLC